MSPRKKRARAPGGMLAPRATPLPTESGYEVGVVQAGTHRVYVRDFRSTACPAVVLVHGAGVSGRYLVPTAQALDGRVLIPDLPGFGRSSRPRGLLALPDLAAVLGKTVQALGLQEAVFLGHSFGCQVVLELAVRRPAMVKGLILVGPTFDSSARTYPRQAARFVRTMLREPVAFFPVAIRDYVDCRIWRALGTIVMGMNDRPEEKLRHVQAPSLVVRGGRDHIAPPRWAELVARGLPHGRLLVVPRAAHAVNVSHPRELAEAVTVFGSSLCKEDHQEKVRASKSHAQFLARRGKE